jgi:hypothetical protein
VNSSYAFRRTCCPLLLGSDGNLTLMPAPSLLSVLRERAGLQPNDTCLDQYRQQQFTRQDA